LFLCYITGECRSIYGFGILKVHEKIFFGDESALVSCMVLWKMVCTDNSRCLRALFGAVGLKMGHNGTTENSALGGIYSNNRLPLVYPLFNKNQAV
jgi:hypothetical protein